MGMIVVAVLCGVQIPVYPVLLPLMPSTQDPEQRWLVCSEEHHRLLESLELH